ncbi:chaperone for protein-folding within the ER, fungal-domain-containing protein [Tuber indicum]|nr:chaperone for protein-folding within the ER, fungal-domain-containing protein [Tuber indicum]
MLPSLSVTPLAVTLLALPFVSAQDNVTSLTGTWSSKSNAVFTGPASDCLSLLFSFYDPVNEKFFEPTLTGTSYSFTDDGFYEEAVYIAVANPTNPSCTKGVLQWQHGRYVIAENGSIVLHPIMVDGRQLYSDPCKHSTSIYTRFNTTEVFKRWEIFVDEYRGMHRLNLYKFDGAPMNPMYLAYRPPQMLPTQTLNPTVSAPKATRASKLKVKRALPSNLKKAENINADRWWWIGVGMTSVGFLGFFLE